MSAEHPTHPFDQAWATWQAWSSAHTWRSALERARGQGNTGSVACIENRAELTEGPGPLAALAANRELVQTLTGWRWQAMRDAREQGHTWAEIGQALGVAAEQARHDYLEAVSRQRRAAQDPELARLLGFDPAWGELAADTDADRLAPEREGGGGGR